MAGVNKVIILGRIGKDPEVRYAQSGMAICKLSVAVSTRVKKGDEWTNETEWFRVVTFGKTAENAGQYLEKGREVHVIGRLKTDKYKDKDGNERTSTEVIADEVTYVGGKGNGGSRAPREAAPPREAPPPPEAPPDDGFIDDDLPF